MKLKDFFGTFDWKAENLGLSLKLVSLVNVLGLVYMKTLL